MTQTSLPEKCTVRAFPGLERVHPRAGIHVRQRRAGGLHVPLDQALPEPRHREREHETRHGEGDQHLDSEKPACGRRGHECVRIVLTSPDWQVPRPEMQRSPSWRGTTKSTNPTRNKTAHDCHDSVRNSFSSNRLCRVAAMAPGPETGQGLQAMTPSAVAGARGPPVPIYTAQVQVIARSSPPRPTRHRHVGQRDATPGEGLYVMAADGRAPE